LTMIKYDIKNRFAKSARACLSGRVRSRAIRAERFFKSIASHKLRVMEATATTGRSQSCQRNYNFTGTGPETLPETSFQKFWRCPRTQKANQETGLTLGPNRKNPGLLQRRKVSIHGATYNSSIAKQSYGSKNNDLGKFLIFHLPDLLKILSFRPFTLAPSNDISDQTLSIPHTERFRKLRGQTCLFSVKIRAVLNKLLRSAAHSIKFFSFF